jgi:Tfp pilus assembly PilM family ATPase
MHLVAASVHRGRVRIERALTWREDEPVTPANAEAFGERLKQRLKEAKVAVAPVIVGLGRDRVVVKEVRFPQVSADVEAALVRNQIIKDLTDAPEDVLLDYFPLSDPGKAGERRALSMVVRKDLVNAIQASCRVAGLKLVGITGRPFGVAACVQRLAGKVPAVPAPPAPDAVVGVLTVTNSWGEFAAMRGDELLFARPVAPGDGLLGEVRRNLAAYAGQPHLTFPRDALQALYVAGNGENAVLREKLGETLGVPVHGMDPFAGEDRVDVAADNRSGYTGAVGLLQLWAAKQALPFNFVKPRESKPVTNPARRRVLVYSLLGVLVIAALAIGAVMIVNENKADIEGLRLAKAKRDQRLKELQVEIKYLEALKEWYDGALPWLDELYDLTVRVSSQPGLKVTQISCTPLQAKGNAKDKEKERFLTRMVIQGEVLRKDNHLVKRLLDSINKDPHCKATTEGENVKSGQVTDPRTAIETFTIRVDLAHQPSNLYSERLVPPPQKKKKTPDPDEEVDPDGQ